MPQESFLARRAFGLPLPNWLLIALVTCFVLGWVPRGVRQSILTNSNNAADWLPDSYAESKDLIWFSDHFLSSQFVLTSWDGCTLGNLDQLRLLADKLRAAENAKGEKLFARVITGPEMIATLTQEPARLSTHAAVERLEGALVGPPGLDANGEPLPDETRTTCLIAYLSPLSRDGNRRMREAVTAVQDIATTECGVPAAELHLGGPPVDNITIDIEGEKTLRRLAILSGLVGLSLAYWFFRSLSTTVAVFAVAVLSAGASLALVYYYNVGVERWLLGMERPRLGTVDAILLSMPAVVYVLGLAGAIHLVNYYRDERDERGAAGAVERAVRISWGPCVLAAFTTAVGLGSLAFSDIIPIMKFGAFTAAGVMATLAILFTVLPIFLHVAPPRLRGDDHPDATGHSSGLPTWAWGYVRFVTNRPNLVTLMCVLAMALAAIGLPRIKTSVQLLKLLDPDVKLIHDYAWLEEHLGNLVPMEVVVTLTPEQLRKPDETAVGDAGEYRMTLYERMHMAQRIERRIEALPDVGRALSAASFGPEEDQRGVFSSRAVYPTSMILEENRGQLAEYMRTEIPREGASGPPRELWRVSARVAALKDIDYGQFVNDLRGAVNPVLGVYKLRDQVVKHLHDQGKQLLGSRVCVVFEPQDQAGAESASPAAMLVGLLNETGVRRGRRGELQAVNVDLLAAADAGAQQAKLAELSAFDAVVAASPAAAEAFGRLAPGLSVTSPGADPAPGEQHASPAFDADASLAAVYTGIVPLVYKTQRELLASLRESILWATVLIAAVMMAVFRNVAGGIISMLPNVFPVILVFGGIGWLGIKVDIGIMMTASVALGVAVDDTIHFLTWFRRGVRDGLDRRTATRQAFERCGVAMCQTTLIAGLGLAVFATSTFTPTQQFGTLMITILTAALVGDLLMLPALLCGPLGWFFAPRAGAVPATDAPPAPMDGARTTPPPAAAAAERTPEASAPPATEPASGPTPPGPREERTPPRTDALSPANAALHSKLRRLRRRVPPD